MPGHHRAWGQAEWPGQAVSGRSLLEAVPQFPVTVWLQGCSITAAGGWGASQKSDGPGQQGGDSTPGVGQGSPPLPGSLDVKGRGKGAGSHQALSPHSCLVP